MATAELAVVIPALLLVLAMCLTGLSLASDQVRCVDAARAAARAAARGESPDRVTEIALGVAPAGAEVSIDVDSGRGEVQVRVEARVRTTLLPGLPRAGSSARAPLEPAVSGKG